MPANGTAVPEGTVTLLSTDLVGSSRLNQELGDEASAAIEREIKALTLKQIAKHDGIVIKDTGDGLMVAFRSARRAIVCARELQREISHRNRTQSVQAVRLRIGLHTGEVLSENSDLKGETVIVTKRIEEVAPPGGIYASETVYGVLGTTRTELKNQGDFELKGISTPWQLYEVPWDEKGVKLLAPNMPTPFVGRPEERTHLIELMERIKKASGSMVLIAGEAGIGKTRLTEEVAQEARRLGLLVLLGHCLEIEGAPPYLPFIEQINHAARIVNPDALREALGDSAPEVAKLLPDLRQRYSDIPEPVKLPPEQERHYLQHGVCEYIERAASVQPMLLIFENLHWADESSLLVLHHLAQRLHEIPVLVIGTYRHDEIKPGSPFATVLPTLLRHRLAQEFVLTRFKEDGVAALLEGRAGRKPPTELVSLIFSETEGNPFFTEEVFHHLYEAGKLLDDEGNFRPDIQITDTEVPRGVKLIISQRLRNISAECRQMLTRVAGLGHNFDFNLITALIEFNEDILLDALDEAEEANIVKDVSSGRDARYSFVHEQIRQTLLAELSTPRRQRLHLRIANTMEQLYGEYVENYASEIAHHLYQAGTMADGARTARYLLLAGERARAASAFDEAIQMFDAAETVLPSGDSTTLANIYYSQGMALRGLGKMEKALNSFQDSIDLLPSGNIQNCSIQARAHLLLGLFRGHEAIQDLETLLSRAQEIGDKSHELEVLLDLGRAYYIISLNESGGGERAFDCYEQAYKIAKDIRDKTGMVRALIPTHHLVDYWPDFRSRAMANIDEAARLSEEIGKEELICDCTQARFRFLSPGEAHEQTEALLDRFKALRDPLRLKEHYFWLMWHYRRVGEFERSVEICDAGEKLADELGAHPVQYNTIKALSLINLGRYGEAWDALQREVTEETFGYAMQQYGLTFYLFDLQAFERAAEQARKTYELAKELDRAWMMKEVQNLYVTSLAQLGTLDETSLAKIEQDLKPFSKTLGRQAKAETMLSTGSLEEALELADAAITNTEKAGMKLYLIPALELKLRILLDLKNVTEALIVADNAFQQALQTGYQPMMWRILAGRARAREAAGDEIGAKQDIQSAAAIASELAETIPDQELRQEFKTNPLVAPILNM